MIQYKKTIWCFVVSMALGGLLACGGLETRIEDRNVRLQQRLDEYLAARKNADIIEMQKFHRIPGQARVGSIIYKNSEIVSSEIKEEGQKAETKLKNTIQAMGFTFKKVPQTLYWVWHDKDWFMVIPESSTHPFGKSKPKPKGQELQKSVEPKKIQ